MTKNIKNLVNISASILDEPVVPFAGLDNELLELLRLLNGFYAFESALHVFPITTSNKVISLEYWNNASTWKDYYNNLEQGYLYFAEDIFGTQFCLKSGEIYMFDPELAEHTYLASSLEHWAELVLENYSYLTGYKLAHEWQVLNGSLPIGYRLVPKIPFVLGGEFSVGNLYACEAIQGMRSRAMMANQIELLLDGTSIKFNIT